MAQWVKNPPAIQETQATWVESQGQEDPLMEKMTTHSSILAWGIPRTEESGELQSMRAQRVGHNSAHGTHKILWEWWCARFELVQLLFMPLNLWIYHENKLREEERSSERNKSSQLSSCWTSQVPNKLPVNLRSVSLAKSGEGNGSGDSSTLAWKIPWTEEPGGLLSMGSHRVGHDWATSLSLFTYMHWRRKWQPTPVFLPGESQGWGSLVGCLLWGRTESDTTEVT